MGRLSTVTLRFAIALFCLTTAAPLAAADRTTAGEFIAEPPTLVSLGFEWQIDGDDNRNAAVAVSYRKKGEQAWKAGLPLLRIGNERINENALQYMTPNGFAGSIFDLEPAHRVRVPVRPVGSRRRRRQSRSASSRSARAPNRSRRRAARSTTSIRRTTRARGRSRRSPACWPRTTPARRIPTTSTPFRRACSRATRSWCTPASTRTTATATAAAVRARSRAAPTS